MIKLPNGWTSTNFANCSDIKLGKMLDQAKNVGDPTTYLRNINVRWGDFDLSDLSEMRMSELERAKLDIRGGDVLVCEGGEPGRSAVWKRGSNGLTFQKALMRVRPLQGVEPQFLAAVLNHASATGDLDEYFTGTTIKHLPQAALSSVFVPLPPLGEQRRIVAKVESLSVRSKRARDELERALALTEKFKDAIVQNAFDGTLTSSWRAASSMTESASSEEIDELRRAAFDQWNATRSKSRRYQGGCQPSWQPRFELPVDWRWASVDEISCSIQYGSSSKTDRDPAGVVVLRMGNIQKGKIDYSDVRFLPQDHPEFSDLLLANGDLVFNRTNSFELVGKTAVFEGCEPTSFASYLIRL